MWEFPDNAENRHESNFIFALSNLSKLIIVQYQHQMYLDGTLFLYANDYFFLSYFVQRNILFYKYDILKRTSIFEGLRMYLY